MTLGLTTLCTQASLSHIDTQHKHQVPLKVIRLSEAFFIVILSVVMLSVSLLSVVILRFVMLSVFILSVIMLSAAFS